MSYELKQTSDRCIGFRTGATVCGLETRRIGDRRSLLAGISLILALFTSACIGQPAKSVGGVQITESTNSLRIEINGALFTEYRFGPSEPRPYFYPLLGPGGAGMTRNWPMKETPARNTTTFIIAGYGTPRAR